MPTCTAGACGRSSNNLPEAAARASPWCDAVTIDRSQLLFYRREGYLVVKGAVSKASCDRLQRAAAPLADEAHSVVLNVHRQVEEFRELMRDPVLVRMVKTVQGGPIVGLNSQYLFKKAGTPYARQSWTPHQDNSYPKARWGAYLIVHLALEDSDPGNGGLIFWPGSHLEEVLDFEQNKSWKESFDAGGVSHPGQTVAIPPEYCPIDMHVPQGALCFMHGNLIHGSYPNLSSTRSRPQYSMAFLNRSEAFEPGKTSIKEPMELEG